MPDTRLKQTVTQRANGCCEYCRSQSQFATDPFSVEHILPQARGGPTVLSNLALSCQGCNNFKHVKIEGIDPVSNQSAPLYNPRQQRWRDHFAWNEDCSLIIGQTPTGRVTVRTLKLNRESVVNLRRVLYQVGRHPPEDSAE